MKRILTLASLALLLFSAASCKTAYETLLESNDTDAKYNAAFDYFNQGKYSKASQLFESISMTESGSARADTIQYYWGLSNYRARDYYTAETNFNSFVSNNPKSPFVEDATYLRIDCLYRQTLRYELDQTPTYTAMAAISTYMLEFPDSPNIPRCRLMLDDLGERLDRKAFENARLYYHMEDYKASRVAFRNILKEDADNIYREEILYYTAMSSFKYADLSVPAKQKERYLVFVDDYYNFLGEYPESSHRKELDNIYESVQKKMKLL